jgi:CRISPR/Cas system-associated endoribonuclease Cas2
MPLRTKNSLVIDEFLRLFLLGGIGATALMAPNAIGALEKPLEKAMKHIDRSVDKRQLAYYMKRTDIVEVEQQPDGSYTIRLTGKGERRGHKVMFENMEVPRPARWDGRWRLVVFDVPEKHRNARFALSEKLKELGFCMLQKSLWVHPFPCLEQIAVIKHVYPEVADYVVMLEADSIDQHNRLVKRFASVLPL